MKPKSATFQPDLFEPNEPPMMPAPSQKEQLAKLWKPCFWKSQRCWQPGRPAMSKITVEHLDRAAFVYIRQSTADQLLHNQESQRRQYGLTDRARQLGWTSIEVIDDDLD